MKVGILTGGGDCPGLNAVIRAVARRSFTRGQRGGRRPRGLARARRRDASSRSARSEISGLLPRGGTILGTSRTNPYKVDGGVEAVLENFEREGLDALVAIGGEDTLGVAARLHAEHDFPVVGVPKTIDNDLSGTDYTFGFDTAVWICTEAIDRLHTTAESHNRVMVRRGDGPPHGLDRGHQRHRRRRRRDPDPRAPGLDRGRLQGDPAPARPRQGLLDRRRLRGLRARGSAATRAERASTSSGTCGSRARRRRRARAARSRSAPASRRASPCSATSSAAARRPRATACSPRATG